MGLFDDLIPAAAGPPGVPRITVTPGNVERPSMPPEGRQLLDAIAGSESPGYNVKYGGGTFNDFADHPRQAVPITSGPNAGNVSTAAGRYQFLAPTWDQVKKEAGLTDFSPDSQDAGAWYLANKTYQQRTGRDLAQDLQSAKGDHRAVQQIGSALSKVWTSLPGGIEPNRATSSFASRYDGGTNPATDFSAQSRQPAGRIGLFDDLAPQGQVAAPPVSGPPSVLAGGEPAPRVAREGVSEPAPPPTSAMEAGARGVATGVTANFYDELRGLMEAGGLNPKDPASLGALLSGAYKYWTGDPKAAETYDMTTARERGLTQKAEADQPVASIGGNLVGGAVLPVGAAARGATLAERATQGARVGAAVGGLSGVGAGDDTAGRIAGGAVGAGLGAALGQAAPYAVEGATKAGQGVSRLAAPIVQAVRGVRDPEAEAARRVTGALRRDVQNGSAGLNPAEFAAERTAGSPVAIADMGGAATRSLARSAADTSAEGRAALEAVTSDRYITQNPRMSQFIKETFDFPDVGAKLDQVQAAARRANAPAYLKAYKDGGAGIWDDGLEQFSQAPVIQDAIRTAFLTARNKAAMEGFPPIKNPFELNKSTGVYELKANADGSQALPNLQFWDHVKRNLDKVNSSESRAAATALRNHLDEIVPSYKDARQGAAGWFGAEDALDAGAKFATMSGLDAMKLAQARGHVAKMSDADRKLFETGFVSNLLAKIESRQDGQDIVKAVFNSPFAVRQAQIALGPEKAGMLEAKLQTERVMNALKNEVSGGSPTARRLYELGMAGATNPWTLAGATAGASSYASGGVGPGDAFAAGLVFAARKGQIRIDERVARHVGEMLASDSAATVTKGLKIVARNENMKRALRAFDMPSSRAVSQQAPGVPAVQAAGIGRADNQQDVPGP